MIINNLLIYLFEDVNMKNTLKLSVFIYSILISFIANCYPILSGNGLLWFIIIPVLMIRKLRLGKWGNLPIVMQLSCGETGLWTSQGFLPLSLCSAALLRCRINAINKWSLIYINLNMVIELYSLNLEAHLN